MSQGIRSSAGVPAGGPCRNDEIGSPAAYFCLTGIIGFLNTLVPHTEPAGGDAGATFSTQRNVRHRAGRVGASPLKLRWGISNLVILLATCCLFLSSCMVGPKYQRPAAPVPDVYKEPLPEGWKQAQPSDAAIRGKWWEVYNDPQLNALEEQVNVSNQNVVAAVAQYRQARDSVRIARSGYFPTVSAAPAVSSIHTSSNISSSPTFVVGTRADYNLPVDVSYQADVFGSIRRSVAASSANAQVSAADLENVRLGVHAERLGWR